MIIERTTDNMNGDIVMIVETNTAMGIVCIEYCKYHPICVTSDKSLNDYYSGSITQTIFESDVLGDMITNTNFNDKGELAELENEIIDYVISVICAILRIPRYEAKRAVN